MPLKGSTWDDEYHEKYYASPKVKFHLEVFVEVAKKPKSKATKDKMSAAHKDKKFTQEHKDNLAQSQRDRHKIRRKMAELHPTLTKQEHWALVKQIIANGQIQDYI